MRHDHRCRRWKKAGLECPYTRLPDHEEQEDDASEAATENLWPNYGALDQPAADAVAVPKEMPVTRVIPAHLNVAMMGVGQQLQLAENYDYTDAIANALMMAVAIYVARYSATAFKGWGSSFQSAERLTTRGLEQARWRGQQMPLKPGGSGLKEAAYKPATKPAGSPYKGTGRGTKSVDDRTLRPWMYPGQRTKRLLSRNWGLPWGGDPFWSALGVGMP